MTIAPISNAEKCRRYREKHAEKYRKADALRTRKKLQRVVMKTNDSISNEMRLKIQREKKRKYRPRVLEKKKKPGERIL